MRARVCIDKNQNFAKLINFRNRHSQVVYFLPAIQSLSSNYNPRGQSLGAARSFVHLMNYPERRIVKAIADKDDLVSRIVLLIERGEILAQTILKPAARSNHGNKGSELRKRTPSFAMNVSSEAKTAAKRENP